MCVQSGGRGGPAGVRGEQADNQRGDERLQRAAGLTTGGRRRPLQRRDGWGGRDRRRQRAARGVKRRAAPVREPQTSGCSSGRPRARGSAAAREEEPQRAAPEEAATGGDSGDPRGRRPGGARSAARGRRLRDGQTGGWPRKASATDGRPRGWRPAAADGDGADGADG